MAALRSYVTFDSGAQNQAESTVLLNVTHSNLKAMFMELRFDKHVRKMCLCIYCPGCSHSQERAGVSARSFSPHCLL